MRVVMPAERILVVDDEDPIREVVSSMLTSANFVCSQAASGQEALALLQSGENFELMLTDLMMAGMDGQELLGATKELVPRYADRHGDRRSRCFRRPQRDPQRRL